MIQKFPRPVVCKALTVMRALDNIKKAGLNTNMDSKIPYIDKIIPIIISLVSPDQIILFGSYARGDNTEKSDIDLLILKKGLKRGREISGLIYKALLDSEIEVPVDLITIVILIGISN